MGEWDDFSRGYYRSFPHSLQQAESKLMVCQKTESLDDFGWVFMVIPCDTAHVSPAARPAHERPSAAKALHHPWIKVPWCQKNSLGMVECMDSYCDFLWEHMGHGDLMDGVKLTDIWIQNKKTLHIQYS